MPLAGYPPPLGAFPPTFERRAEQGDRPLPPGGHITGRGGDERILHLAVVEFGTARGGGVAAGQFAFFLKLLPRAAFAEPVERIARPRFTYLLQLDERLVLRLQRRAQGQWRVEHRKNGHLFAGIAQLPGHFIGGNSTPRIARQQIGPLGLYLPHLRQVVARGVGYGFMRRLIPDQPARLYAPDGTFPAEGHRQMAQVQHVAEHASHDEKRRGLFLSALIERHQMRVPHRGGGCFGLAQGGGGIVVARTRVLARFLGDQRGAERDGGCLEQCGDGEFHPEAALDSREKPHRDERMPPEVEKAVLRSDRGNTQQRFPDFGQVRLDPRAGGDETVVHIRPLETPAFLRRGGHGHIRLRDERRQRHGRDDDLRQPCRHRAAQGARPFDAADPVAQERRELLFLRGKLGRFPAVFGKGHVAFGQGGCLQPPGQPGHGEAAQLYQNVPPVIADRDVEDAVAIPGTPTRPYPGPQTPREWPVHHDGPVGHRHPEMRGCIAIDQRDGPARRKVHETCVQEMPRRDVIRKGARQAEPGNPLALPQRGFAQDVPARAKGKMRLLGGCQMPRFRGLFLQWTAGADRSGIDVPGLRCLAGRQMRFGVQLPCRAPVEAAGAADLCGEPIRPRLQDHPQGALFVVRQFQRAQEMQIGDLESLEPLRARGFGQKLHIARARQHHAAIGCAMIVQHPDAGMQRGFVNRRPLAIGLHGFQNPCPLQPAGR